MYSPGVVEDGLHGDVLGGLYDGCEVVLSPREESTHLAELFETKGDRKQ